MGRTGLAGAVALGMILVVGGALVIVRISRAEGSAPGGAGEGSAPGAAERALTESDSSSVEGVRMQEGGEATVTPPGGDRGSTSDGAAAGGDQGSASDAAAADGSAGRAPDRPTPTGPPPDRPTPAGPPPDRPTPDRSAATLIPLGSGPLAGSVARWLPVSTGPPSNGSAAAEEASTDWYALPAMSRYADSTVRVVSPDSSLSADSIARAVAARSWDELGELVSSSVPRFVRDALREALNDRGEVRWIHEIATADDRAYIISYSSSVVLLRLYLDNDIVVDLEVEEASLIDLPGGADTDSDVLSPR